MFDTPYSFFSLGTTKFSTANPHKKAFYKFRAQYRWYFVTLECYSFGMVAIKYCDWKDRKSHRTAYHKLFNDGDAKRVIGTCFHIMLAYWRKNVDVNFIFYASLRDVAAHLLENKSLTIRQVAPFIERYKRVRFRIYEYGMINFFSEEYFSQLRDEGNCIYVLLNRNQDNAESIINELTKFLKDNHDIVFEPILRSRDI